VRTLPLIAVIIPLLSVSSGFAAERTVRLAVDNMTCESCPYIVKQSLMKVTGVGSVVVSFEKKTATVTYDDGRTDVASLVTATTNAGYPSQVQP
jgi:periplasmic mercuric ion binding protein